MDEDIELRSVSRIDDEVIINGPYHCDERSRCPDCENFSWLGYGFLVCLHVVLMASHILFICPYQLKYVYGTWENGEDIISREMFEMINGTSDSVCWQGPACELMLQPISIILKNETIFPNFTNSQGQYADYFTLLQDVVSILLYDNCNVSVTILSNTGGIYMKHDKFFINTVYRIMESFLTEGSTCRPKDTAKDIYIWHRLSPQYYKLFNKNDCVFKWNDIYNGSVGASENKVCYKTYDCMFCEYPTGILLNGL